MIELSLDSIESPIGTILVVTDSESLCALDFADYETRMHMLLNRRFKQIELRSIKNPLAMRDRLAAYFNGNLTELDTIPVNPGGTEFQQRVWLGLRSIPAGSAWSYRQLAVQLGNSKAVRAVGMANSLNPIAIVLPCHRVIGANAQLTGYAGGLARKRWLLHHEGVKLNLPASNQLALF